jgi:hypothetical protein
MTPSSFPRSGASADPRAVHIDDLDVRLIHATTGEIIRTLTIDPNRSYHGTAAPIGGPTGPRKTKDPNP